MEATDFGLSRNPFQRSPELDDACLPNTIAALLSELQSSLRSPRGVSVLVGAAGSGKSIAASAFGRRLAGAAHVALLEEPVSSVNAIARDAVSLLAASESGLAMAASESGLVMNASESGLVMNASKRALVEEDDWVAALLAGVARRAGAGRPTVLLIDDAHRLSPQTLEDLATLFGEDETLPLHVFLFGRPRLLDRMHAGAERALQAHLLQICRLEPLGVRECVRYLERRVALCGGELAALYTAEAIDEIVQRAEGRLLGLEDVAAEALRRAAGRGRRKASAEYVVATPRRAVVQEEEEMAVHQQPLRFALTDEDLGTDGEEEWEDEADDDAVVEWGDDAEGDDDGWQADDDDEEDLTWDSSTDEKDDAEHYLEEAVATAEAGASAGRRRLFGPAVLSIGACAVLVWAANHVPGPGSDTPRGRDARILAERISSEPQKILRLASTAEEADADAQVLAWRAQPAPRDSPTRAKAGEEVRPDTPVTAAAERRRQGETEEAGGAWEDTAAMGPPSVRPAVAVQDSGKAEATAGQGKAPAARPQVRPASVAAPTVPAGKAATTPAVRAGRNAAPVYTVQIGAFKARRNAEDLAARLRGKSTRILEEGGLYRVVCGSFPTKKDATVHEASLRRAGYTTYVRSAVF